MQKLAFGGRTTKYQNRESPEKGRTPLISELVETCLGSLAAKGWYSTSYYRRLPPEYVAAVPYTVRRDKTIRRGILRHWREHLLEGGYFPTAANRFISAANSYLDYVHVRELHLTDGLKASRKPQRKLTWNEYLHLLSTPRALGRARVYLLVESV